MAIRKSKKLLKQIEELFDKGLDIKGVAERLGISRMTMYRWEKSTECDWCKAYTKLKDERQGMLTQYIEDKLISKCNGGFTETFKEETECDGSIKTTKTVTQYLGDTSAMKFLLQANNREKYGKSATTSSQAPTNIKIIFGGENDI